MVGCGMVGLGGRGMVGSGEAGKASNGELRCGRVWQGVAGYGRHG